MHQAALLKACKIVGNQSLLAKKIRVERTRLNKWLNHGKEIPYQYAIAIEYVTQGLVSRYELAPTNSPINNHLETLDRISRLEVRVAAIEELLLVSGKGKL